MNNKAMERKLQKGDAIDVATCPRTLNGEFLLQEFVDGKDYCDSKREDWVWSIGRAHTAVTVLMEDGGQRELPAGSILASTNSRFYQALPTWECLFLR